MDGAAKARTLLTDAALGGLVAAAMALPMLGVRLEDSANGLSLSNRLVSLAGTPPNDEFYLMGRVPRESRS